MNHPIYKVEAFTIVGPYTLSIRFNDGLVRRIDFSPTLRGEVFGPLQDRDLFEQVKLNTEVHTLEWPNGADFDPATLHDWPEDSQAIEGAVGHWGLARETGSVLHDKPPPGE